MQPPYEAGDESELTPEQSQSRRRVERIVEERRRLRREDYMTKVRRERAMRMETEQAERDALARRQVEAELEAIPTDPEFEAWLEGRHRTATARGGLRPGSSPPASPAPPTTRPTLTVVDDIPADRPAPAEAEVSAGGVETEDGAPDENVLESVTGRDGKTRRRVAPPPRHRQGGWRQSPPPSPPSRPHRATVAATATDEQAATPDEEAADDTMADGTSPSPTSRRKRPLWRAVRRLTLLGMLFGAVYGVVLFLTSPRFAVQQVEVTGLDITPPQPVADVQSTLTGQNWARARVGAARKRLEALPTVREAEVVRLLTWPPRLGIRLHEREPFARVGSGRNWWVVDDAGVPFRRMDDHAPADRALLPLTGKLLAPQLGRPLTPGAWTTAAKLASLMQNDVPSGASQAQTWHLRRLYIDEDGTVSLRLAGGDWDGMLVRLGSENWERKLARARQALTFFAATGRHAAILDLVSLNRPAVWTEQASNPDAQSPSRTDAVRLSSVSDSTAARVH